MQFSNIKLQKDFSIIDFFIQNSVLGIVFLNGTQDN